MTDRTALVIADDLTGAADTGNAFARRGAETVVVFDGRSGSTTTPAAAVLVVNTDSRYTSAEEAAERVDRAVRAHPADLVYKKVDSTLRGNLAAEVDAALAAAGATLAVVAPAFPANGRVTACGHHLVDGELVTDTAAGQDPDAPVGSSHLPTLLSGSAHPVAHLAVDTVAGGTEAVADGLRTAVANADGPTVVTADATHERHLAAVAEGTATVDPAAVYVGSAGLARHVPLPAIAGAADGTIEADRKRSGPSRVLGVAGSASPVTLAQVDAVPEEWVCRIDAARAAVDPPAAATEAVDRCRDRLSTAGVALLASATDETDVEAALSAGREAGLADQQVRDRVARALAETVARLQADDPLTGLFVTGGAVAGAVLGELEAEGVRLTGRAVEDGVPVGAIVAGRAAGTPVVTKAGAFGERTTVNACLAYLRGENGR